MADMRELHDRIARELVDQGKLIEAGFQGLRLFSIPPDAPLIQVMEMRKAFFAGAQHLFGTMMGMLESGTEATDNDFRRMDLINAELAQFVEEMKRGA